ncbi:MAG TPA: acyl-CoA dehydrogenase family protein, partial [Streptosporangiaceae bacterium]
MALALTPEHAQLADSVRGWAARTSPPTAVRSAADGPDHGAALYRDVIGPGLSAQGLLGLHVPERDGGQGFGLSELSVAVEELGRALVPGSFVPTVLASAVLISAGQTGKVVSALADGSGNGSVTLSRSLHATAAPDGSLIVSGSVEPVLGAVGADVVIAPVSLDAGTIWVAMDAAGLDITPVESLDLTRQLGRVRADGVVVPADGQLTGLGYYSVANIAAVLLGAETV